MLHQVKKRNPMKNKKFFFLLNKLTTSHIKMAQAVFEEVNVDDCEDKDVGDESRADFRTWKDWEPKYKLLLIISTIVFLSIGYFVSLLLSMVLSTLYLLYGGFMWFSSTNLSVEITVFLGKFFPPSSKCVWNCRNTGMSLV
eukprot:945135_1